MNSNLFCSFSALIQFLLPSISLRSLMPTITTSASLWNPPTHFEYYRSKNPFVLRYLSHIEGLGRQTFDITDFLPQYSPSRLLPQYVLHQKLRRQLMTSLLQCSRIITCGTNDFNPYRSTASTISFPERANFTYCDLLHIEHPSTRYPSPNLGQERNNFLDTRGSLKWLMQEIQGTQELLLSFCHWIGIVIEKESTYGVERWRRLVIRPYSNPVNAIFSKSVRVVPERNGGKNLYLGFSFPPRPPTPTLPAELRTCSPEISKLWLRLEQLQNQRTGHYGDRDVPPAITDSSDDKHPIPSSIIPNEPDGVAEVPEIIPDTASGRTSHSTDDSLSDWLVPILPDPEPINECKDVIIHPSRLDAYDHSAVPLALKETGLGNTALDPIIVDEDGSYRINLGPIGSEYGY